MRNDQKGRKKRRAVAADCPTMMDSAQCAVRYRWKMQLSQASQTHNDHDDDGDATDGA